MSRKDDKTGDLFSGGLQEGYDAAKRAADHAGESWQEQAFAAFRAYAFSHHEFTTEAVRLANQQIPAPPDNRAWGHIPGLARSANVIAPTGKKVHSKSRHVHGTWVALWRSKVYRP